MSKEKNGGQQMRITDKDLQILKATFAENDELVKLLRKIFLPELSVDAPLGQNIDLWMTMDLKEMTADEIAIQVLARNTVIQHVEQQLQTISLLAGRKDETPEETKERLQKNSSK